MGSDRDARTASQVQDVAIDVEWISEPLQEQINDFRDHARIAAIGNNDDELVAAESAYLGGPCSAAPVSPRSPNLLADQTTVAPTRPTKSVTNPPAQYNCLVRHSSARVAKAGKSPDLCDQNE
jgi:hypothetical protein